MNDSRNKNPADLREYILLRFTSISQDLEGQSRTLIKVLDSLDELESRQKKLYSMLEEQIKQQGIELEKCSLRKSTADSELSRLQSEIESLKKALLSQVNKPLTPVIQHEEKKCTPPQGSNTALLPGGGFASITPEYLRNLKKK